MLLLGMFHVTSVAEIPKDKIDTVVLKHVHNALTEKSQEVLGEMVGVVKKSRKTAIRLSSKDQRWSECRFGDMSKEEREVFVMTYAKFGQRLEMTESELVVYPPPPAKAPAAATGSVDIQLVDFAEWESKNRKNA